MNILEDFWYGNINPQEESKEQNREIRDMLTLIGRNRDALSSTLSDEQREVLEKYDDCVNEMYGMIEVAIFSYAFRLGGRLMLATLLGGDIS